MGKALYIILLSVSLFVQHVPMLVTCIEAHIQVQICNTLITLAKTIHKFKPVVYLATLCTGCIYTYSIMSTRVCMHKQLLIRLSLYALSIHVATAKQ